MKNYLALGLLLALAVLAACSSLMGIDTQEKKIQLACESAASSADAVSAAREAGVVSQSFTQDTLKIYTTAVAPVCLPLPAQSLDAVKYAALQGAVAELIRRQGAIPR